MKFEKLLDDYLIPAAAFIALSAFLCSQAKAREPFAVPFKPLRSGPAMLEAAWQVENLIDLSQTLKIARSPDQWQEVGTLSLLYGAHPTVSQVWVGSLLFGLGHYAVSALLENADMPKTLAVWQVTSLTYKTWDLQRNERVGLGY
jgi:hypothetical protein